MQQVVSSGRESNDCEFVDDCNGGHDSKEPEPVPDNEVSLFIENVQWKDTKVVILGNVSRRTILVEPALCHGREDLHHRIRTDSFIDIPAIRPEMSSQEPVYPCKLDKDMNHVENFADKVSKSIGIVLSSIQNKVLDQRVLMFFNIRFLVDCLE